MGKIIVSTNVSLDGVVQDPDGKEDFKHGGWFVQSGGRDLAEWAAFEQAEAERTQALLLGRRSDEWFAARWPQIAPASGPSGCAACPSTSSRPPSRTPSGPTRPSSRATSWTRSRSSSRRSTATSSSTAAVSSSAR